MEPPGGADEPSIAAAEQFLNERIPNRDELGHDPLDLNSSRYASGEWRLAFPESPFEEPQEARLPNPQTLDRDGLVAFFASMGWIADFPDVERLPLLDEVRSLLAKAEIGGRGRRTSTGRSYAASPNDGRQSVESVGSQPSWYRVGTGSGNLA